MRLADDSGEAMRQTHVPSAGTEGIVDPMPPAHSVDDAVVRIRSADHTRCAGRIGPTSASAAL
jgi:hypothetical protein